jgi:hypothetical protein
MVRRRLLRLELSPVRRLASHASGRSLGRVRFPGYANAFASTRYSQPTPCDGLSASHARGIHRVDVPAGHAPSGFRHTAYADDERASAWRSGQAAWRFSEAWPIFRRGRLGDAAGFRDNAELAGLGVNPIGAPQWSGVCRD